MSRSGHVYGTYIGLLVVGSYVDGAYLAGAALEYCLKDWELVTHLS